MRFVAAILGDASLYGGDDMEARRQTKMSLGTKDGRAGCESLECGI